MENQINKSESTDEQIGKILRVTDEIGHFDKGLEFIKKYHTKDEAHEFIMEVLRMIDTGKVSSCCGVTPKGNGDSDTSDVGICPECKDHCEYGYYFEND